MRNRITFFNFLTQLCPRAISVKFSLIVAVFKLGFVIYIISSHSLQVSRCQIPEVKTCLVRRVYSCINRSQLRSHWGEKVLGQELSNCICEQRLKSLWRVTTTQPCLIYWDLRSTSQDAGLFKTELAIGQPQKGNRLRWHKVAIQLA